MQTTIDDAPDAVDLHRLFPDGAACACCAIGDHAASLHPQEQAAVARAVKHRQMEFATGRACARRALERIGCRNPLLVKNPDGTPAWPPGVVGSIAHSTTWCAAAVAHADTVCGIGLDIETIARVHLSIARRVMTAEELRLLENASPADAQALLCLVFSAKEAVYKCLYPVWKQRLGFYDAVIRLRPAEGGFDVQITAAAYPVRRPLAGRYLLHEGTVFTGIALPAAV